MSTKDKVETIPTLQFDGSLYNPLWSDNPYPKILCVVPDAKGWQRSELTALTNAGFLTKRPFQVRVVPFKGANSWDLGFNWAVQAALDLGADALWLWDSDMGPDDHDPLAILDHYDSADILTPCVYNWLGDNPNHFHAHVLAGDKATDDPSGKMVQFPAYPCGVEPYKVDAAQTGGLLIKRHVLLDNRMLEDRDPSLRPRPFFYTERLANGVTGSSCDVRSTLLATSLGYKILIVPTNTPSHWQLQDMRVVVNYGTWIWATLTKEWFERYFPGVEMPPGALDHIKLVLAQSEPQA